MSPTWSCSKTFRAYPRSIAKAVFLAAGKGRAVNIGSGVRGAAGLRDNRRFLNAVYFLPVLYGGRYYPARGKHRELL